MRRLIGEARSRNKLMLAALTVVAACAALLVGAAGKSNASIPSNFVQGSATLKLEGCSQDGTIALPNGSGEFVCPNDSDYTTGNLAKLWNELDLVPFRLTTTTHGGDPTDYNVIVAGDYQLNAATGWDVVGDPSINAGKSDAACTVSANAQDVGPGITGGADNSIYRVLRIHQDAGTTCVIDYYMRLALGAHLYSGSSLQAYVFSSSDFNGGKKTVPLPVGAIKPQAISKNMTATQNTNTPWNLTKSATPDTISYGNVCDSNFSNTSNVGITVTWTKLAAVPSGQVLLVTNIYAANPAARVIHTSVSDQMYAGTDQTNPLGSPATASADVPANTANYLLLTHTQTVAASSVTHYNDIATATYTDLVTGVPVPGNTTASAGADITSGSNTNSNATVTDSESISGSGLHFKVTSRTGSPTGSYTNGYTQGNYVDGTTTPAEVDWSSGSNAISGTGSITFNKTIKLDPAQATSGALSDTAILNGSDGFGPINAPLSVNLSSSKLGTLTITKTIPNVLQGSETATFNLHVYNSSNVDVVDPSVTFTAGQTSKDVAVSGLALGDYTVSEDTATGWQPQASQNVSLTGCNAGVEFDNQNAPAVAQVKKVTNPAGYEAGWVMTLNGPGTPAGGEAVTTTGTGFMPFTTALEEGSYTITETAQTGWTQTNASSECSFTVSYPADNGRTFSCTITNRSRAHVHVNKSFEGSPLTGSEAFTFQLRSGSSAGAAGTILESEIANVADSGVATFTTDLIPGQTYAICEVLQANINTDLTGYNPGGAAGVVCQDFTPTPGQSKEFNVNNTPVAAHAKAVKITVPSGHQSGWTMNLKSGGSVIESGVSIANGSVSFSTDLQDGVSYTIEETSQVGWDQTSATGDCSFTVHYPADANKTFTCTITNTERGSITIKKVTDPASGTGFTFTGDVAGTLDDQQTATTSNLVPGTYHSVEGALTGTGWTLQSISCDDGSSATASTGDVATQTATFKLDPGEHVTCTFTNKSRGHVRVVKTLNGAPLTASSQQFQFQLRDGDQSQHSSAALETLTTNGTNLGTLTFTTVLIPGHTYAMCELLVAGFGPNVSGGYGPYNPTDAPSYLCWNFSITVAQAANNPSLTFNVDNSHATAKGLTIGFWKNHAYSDCKKSKGKQTDVLGQYLDGITLGTTTFRDPAVSGFATECNAVQTLSKNTFSGTNKSSDPLFNMAAQLLAADLNVNTGDTPSSTVASTITAAQALLVKYGWNGQTYTGPLSPADAALANSYNTILDKFNNNQI